MKVMTMKTMTMMRHNSPPNWYYENPVFDYSFCKNVLCLSLKNPFKQGEVLRKKESTKGDWRQKFTEGITNVRDSLKKHAYKVSNRVRQWWRRKKAAGSKNLKAGKSDL
jgi:hypothetical protein